MKTLTHERGNPARFGKVAVLMGGDTREREVSLNTGKAVLEALKAENIDAHAVDVPRIDLITTLQAGQFDRVFIALHGRGGEDGQLQAVLDYLNIPYTGSGFEASCLSMNKLYTKLVWAQYDLPVLPSLMLSPGFDPEEVVKTLGLPLAIKPVHEGSTVGINRVNAVDELQAAFDEAYQCEPDIMAEPWIVGEEYTVGFVGEDVLPSIRIKPATSFYDFYAKYTANDTQYLIPSGLSKKDEKLLQDICQKAYKVLGCEGWGRIDVLRDDKGQFWLLEMNTVPGMTDHSLVPKACAAEGFSFQDLVLAVLESSLSVSSLPEAKPRSNLA